MAQQDPKTETRGPVRFHHVLILERPDLAAHIGVIACQWTEIDMRIGTLLAHILGIDAPLGLLAYLAIDNDGAKMAMLRAIATDRLNTTEMERFNKLFQSIRERRRERNDVVHGSWGIADDHPDALAWQDPRDSVRQFANITASIKGAAIDENEAMAPFHNVRFYRLADFQQIEARVEELSRDIQDFSLEVLKRLETKEQAAQKLP